MVGAVSPAAAQKQIVIGGNAIVRDDPDRRHRHVPRVPRLHALVNSKGGVEGHKIRALEIDHEYKVPPGVESYERYKKEGAVSMAVYGTPQIRR